ncbi:MAG TPA: SDR family NAD(P)-dependent oxidoreductase [Dehalococcoidia bacterium]|nr:SDR family NAD(P)-dependent oxidoreductase [Dehalococcoidia bacterium]
MLLKDRVAIITGGGSGIGRGVAERFAKEGAKLMLVDLNPEGLAETNRLTSEAGAETETFEADVSQTDEVEAFFAKTVECFGRVDICVNNAGIGNPPAPLVAMTDEGFDRTIAVNLRGVFLCMRAAGRQMLAQGGGGRIISVSSQAGKTGFAFLGPYCATKAGVILMTKAMAKEVGASQITVNAVCPGTIDTPLLRGTLDPILKASGQTLEQWALSQPNMPPIPLNRVGYPKDVANLITFLASDDADYMTGQAINISGGQEMH